MDRYDYEEYDNIPEPFVGLVTAIRQRSYSRVRKELRGLGRGISSQEAVQLLAEAMRCRLPFSVIGLILEHCPPIPEIIAADNKDVLKESGILPSYVFGGFSHLGLISWAAEHDRADVLSLLLEHGASPNRTCFTYSPLEAALKGQSLKCVELLMEQPELDTSWTDELLFDWAHSESCSPAVDDCRRAMAPRFSGWAPLSGRIPPIPGPMKPITIVQNRNWPLLERFCRERRTIPLEDGREAIEMFGFQARVFDEKEEQAAFAGALAALLDSCPDLLRGEEECRHMLRCFLNVDGDARERLRPWAESLGRRQIAMDAQDWTRVGHGSFPDHWQALLPNGPVLVIDRWSDIFDPNACFAVILDTPADLIELSPEALRHILDLCPVRGEGQKDALSPVAKAVLSLGDVPLIESLFRPGGLLAAEDPDMLIGYVSQGKCPRANRAAALAFVRKNADYEL